MLLSTLTGSSTFDMNCRLGLPEVVGSMEGLDDDLPESVAITQVSEMHILKRIRTSLRRRNAPR